MDSNLKHLLAPFLGFNLKRLILVLLGLGGLILVYLFQRFDAASYLFGQSLFENSKFIINRTIRFILNDLLTIVIIYGLFYDRKLVIIAFIFQLFGLAILLPLYFYLKLNFEGTSEISSPLLSFLHRLVVNPLLLMLLIPAFYVQKSR